MDARWSAGKRWFTQVKYSGAGNPVGLSQREKTNLISGAKRNDVISVLMRVTPKEIGYTSAKSGRKLNL